VEPMICLTCYGKMPIDIIECLTIVQTLSSSNKSN
jgi:hypothetical protein